MTGNAAEQTASPRSGERSLPRERRALRTVAIEHGNLCTGCRMAVELAGMLEAVGNREEADALFSGTSKVGGAAGLYQIFLEEDAGSAQLLARAYRHAAEHGSADRELLSIISGLLSRRHNPCADDNSNPHAAVSEPLTRRERDVLTKICEGFPNKRIARTLGISPETVKSHVKRIFMKLAVGTRAQAVSRAKSQGLL